MDKKSPQNRAMWSDNTVIPRATTPGYCVSTFVYLIVYMKVLHLSSKSFIIRNVFWSFYCMPDRFMMHISSNIKSNRLI